MRRLQHRGIEMSFLRTLDFPMVRSVSPIIFVIIFIAIFIIIFIILKKNPYAQHDFTAWALFNIAISLIPIIFNNMLFLISGNNIDFIRSISKGELLIISVAIGADSIGKMYMSSSKTTVFGLLFFGSCIIV